MRENIGDDKQEFKADKGNTVSCHAELASRTN